MKDFWQSLGRRSQAGLVVGVMAIILIAATAGWWIVRTDYQVLFADLKPQDAAVMAGELDKLKVPYRIGADGNSLLVDRNQVHATRLKLMGRELPLNGAVGFELFNASDFGMTEFAQKINYQRALQGELTRTILSLAEVRDARVHLAMPEQGLFRQGQSRAKASITLTLKPGQALRKEQVSGMQRLVAAAVPGMTTQDVTILDNQGIALSRPADQEGEAAGGRLDVKRETEDYLSRKAGAVLERAFGPGQALASVDVSLNMDQVRVTTEDVIPGPMTRPGQAAAGVLVRERESSKEGPAPLEARVATGLPAGSGSMQREAEYQVGRRVEQVVSQPGSIRRINVVAIVRLALDARQEEQVRRLVAAAVGASPERGDSIVVQALDQLPPRQEANLMPSATAAGPAERLVVKADLPGDDKPSLPALPEVMGMVLAVLMLLALAVLWSRRSRRDATPLTDAERKAAQAQLHAWLRQDGEAGRSRP